MSIVKSTKIKAIVIFVDIRGFTKWSEGTEVFEHSPDFVASFYHSLQEQFTMPSWTFKALGDGAVLVKEIDDTTDSFSYDHELKAILQSIHVISESFAIRCSQFANKKGQRTDLSLGWGITRGTVNKLQLTDSEGYEYLGPNLNKAARLCDIARPFGVVIDRDDFSKKPQDPNFEFHDQQRRLKSLAEPVSVWVTREIALSFVTREEIRETPEVHIAGFCFKETNKTLEILLSKRNKKRTLFPGLYEGCGGQLRYSESFIDGVCRHYKTELHIEVEVLPEISQFYEIRSPNNPIIPGISFLCRYLTGTPSSDNHDSFDWKTVTEIKAMDKGLFIPGVKEEILSFAERYQDLRKQ